MSLFPIKVNKALISHLQWIWQMFGYYFEDYVVCTTLFLKELTEDGDCNAVYAKSKSSYVLPSGSN